MDNYIIFGFAGVVALVVIAMAIGTIRSIIVRSRKR